MLTANQPPGHCPIWGRRVVPNQWVWWLCCIDGFEQLPGMIRLCRFHWISLHCKDFSLSVLQTGVWQACRVKLYSVFTSWEFYFLFKWDGFKRCDLQQTVVQWPLFTQHSSPHLRPSSTTASCAYLLKAQLPSKPKPIFLIIPLYHSEDLRDEIAGAYVGGAILTYTN